MKRPRLNRRLILEAPLQGPDGAGGFTIGWRVLGAHWAEVVAGTGREAAGVAAALSRTPYRITLRATPVGSPARPLPEQRLRDGTRVFRILSVAEADAGARYLTCWTQEEVSA